MRAASQRGPRNQAAPHQRRASRHPRSQDQKPQGARSSHHSKLLARLRKFYASHKNPEWRFPGVGCGWNDSGITLRQAMRRCRKHMGKAGVWNAINVAAVESGLSKKHDHLSTHTLLHSYGTHLLEGGASVRQVAAYLGHSTLKEVIVYLHLTEISETKGRDALNSLADC